LKPADFHTAQHKSIELKLIEIIEMEIVKVAPTLVLSGFGAGSTRPS